MSLLELLAGDSKAASKTIFARVTIHRNHTLQINYKAYTVLHKLVISSFSWLLLLISLQGGPCESCNFQDLSELVFMCAPTCRGVYVKVRGQLVGVSSLLLPHGFQGLNTDC